MRNPKISVIVPVYNVEKYLARCIDSLLAQSFTDYELILVDDGATDSSGKICDDYAEKDPRIRVIHKENGGLSDARNKGTQEASGEYIIFIDSDDFIEENALELLLSLIMKNFADIAVGGIYNCYENKKIAQCSKNEEFVCSGTKALGYLLEGVLITGSSCGKLIKTELAKKHIFPFGKTYEDAFYMPGLLLDAQSVAVTTRPLYNYWHRAGSITTVPFSHKAMHAIEAYKYTYDKVMESCPEFESRALFRLYWAYFTVLDRMLTTDNFKSLPQYKEVIYFLKKNWFKILKCKYFQKSRRAAAVFLKINVKFYLVLLKYKNKNNGALQ